MSRPFIVIAASAVLLLSAATTSPASTPIAREVERLARVIDAAEKRGVPKPIESMPGELRTALGRVREASSPDIALYRLRDVEVGVESLACIVEEKKALESLDAFRALWKRRRAAFVAKGNAHGSPLERALEETASSRAETLYKASLPYALSTDAFSGLYYLAEGEGNLRFRRFVDSIAGRDAGPRANAAAVAAQLDSFEAKALAAYGRERDDRAMIPVSVRLKSAREMLGRRMPDGAALALFEAQQLLDKRKGDDAISARFAGFVGQSAGRVAATPAKSAVVVTLVRWPYT